MARTRWPLAGLCALAACVNQVTPSVSPEKVPPVTPPIHARAVLLLTPSFMQYESEFWTGEQWYRYHYGEAAREALSDLLAESFTDLEIRRVAEVDALSALAAPADTSLGDILLVPSLERAGTRQRAFDQKAEVLLRLDARSLRNGTVFVWRAGGGTARLITSQRGLSGSALEKALAAVSDSLAARRAELEPAGPDG